jgi:PAS domain S-box-containing protein
MNPINLFVTQIFIYAAFPFYITTLRKSIRSAAFYTLLSIYLVIGGFLGSVYSLPVTEIVNISGGNLAYGAFMMTVVLFVIIENDIGVLRNTIRLVVTVNVFKVLFFTTISWALQSAAVINPSETSYNVFQTSVFFVILGGLLIIFELYLFMVIFEQLKKKIENIYVLTLLYALVYILVLSLDGVLFPMIAFGFNANIVSIVIGGVTGKIIMSIAYSIPILIYLLVFRHQLSEFLAKPLELGNFWRVPKEELVAEIQRQRQELTLSEERFDLAVKGSNDGIWDWKDMSQDGLWWSDRLFEILDYQPGQCVPTVTFWNESMHPDDQERVLETLENHIQENAPCEVEFRMMNRIGEYVWLYTRGATIRDQDGNSIRMAGSVSDVTMRIEAEKELQRYRENLEEIISERTERLNILVDAMAGREVRMAELKKVIKKLRSQISSAGMHPIADDPLNIDVDENNFPDLATYR